LLKNSAKQSQKVRRRNFLQAASILTEFYIAIACSNFDSIVHHVFVEDSDSATEEIKGSSSLGNGGRGCG
jgi:hypothetical protein